jgi:Na+-transporting methylmalonyl-CoA/oxaloacetate decarboxylase gamma subunit
MLRLLRHDEQTRKEWRLWLVALLSLVLCSAAAFLMGSAPFLHAVGAALGALYRIVIGPLLMGIVYLMIAIVWLIGQMISLFKPGSHAADSKPQDIFNNFNLDLSENAAGTDAGRVKDILLALAIVIAVVASIVITFKLFRRLAESAGKTHEGTNIHTRREAVANSRGRLAVVLSTLTPRTPRETVRWYYRKFLLKAKAGGIKLALYDTSESIARSAATLFDPVMLSELQKIYVIARYSSETVTAGDVKRVREIYSKLRSAPHDATRPLRHVKAYKAENK